MSGAQLLARVQPAALTPEPFPVQEVGARQRQAQARAGESLDRLAVQALGGLALVQERAAAGLDPSAQSVPPARVDSARRVSAAAASSRCPLRAAASTSSTSATLGTSGPHGRDVA